MARPKTITLTLVVDPNGVCLDQTTGGAANLLLNGALVDAVTSVYTSTTAQQMGIESAGNLSGVTFTFTGKGILASGRYSDSISEAVTGPNATTVETLNYYSEITNIAVSGTVGTNVEIGPVDEAMSQLIPLNYRRNEDVGIAASVTGTINYDVDITLSDIQDADAVINYLIDASVLAAKTTNGDMTIDGGARAVRVQVNSGADTGSVTLDVVQS